MSDEQSLLNVEGYGMINYVVHGKRIWHKVYYVPNLGTTLFFVKQHIQDQGCYFHMVAEDTHQAFPQFVLSPRVDTEIDMIVKVGTDSTLPLSINEETAIKVNIRQQQGTAKWQVNTNLHMGLKLYFKTRNHAHMGPVIIVTVPKKP